MTGLAHEGRLGALRARVARTPPGYPYSIGRILAIYGGLMVVVFLGALDQTIVATAVPHIVPDLGGLSNYSWIFTAYLLCQTVSVPIYGKLGDIYGRRPLLLTAIAIFLVGSILCGLAQNITELVLFRGVQGVGAGGLMPLVMATVGELVPPRDRGRYQGLISAMVGTAAIIGPAVGGLIVDNWSWRWIFYINLPIGAVALLVISITMPKRAVKHAHVVDYTGATLFTGGAGALLIALAWGGGTYAWGSQYVLGALLVSAVLLAAFVFVERRAVEPMIPFDLLREPIVATGAVSMALGTACLFGSIAFGPLFVQGVIGTSATSSGFALTPLMLGAVTGSIASGQWVARTGRYRINALLGPVVLGTGMLLSWRMGTGTTTAEVARNMAITGIGLGLMNQVFIVAAQNAVPTKALGTVTALLQFSRAMGTALGVTIFGTIINQNLPSGILQQGRLVHQLSNRERGELASAFHPAFLFGVLVCVTLFLVVLFGLEERPLRGTVEDSPGVPGESRPRAALADAESPN
jgi:EmrB/QacA subfamily drug resistance transporter